MKRTDGPGPLSRRRHGLLLLLSALLALPLQAAVPEHLRVCGDENFWPPYTFFAEHDGKTSTEATGYSVEFLRAVLATTGRSATIELMPWKRCLALAQSGQYELVLDVLRSPERVQAFLFPLSHFRVSIGYLYSKARQAPVLNAVSDLQKYRLCQQAGFSYNLPLPKDQAPILNAEAKSFDAAVNMLDKNRCDVLLSNLEFHAANVAAGRFDAKMAERIGVAPLRLPEPLVFEMYYGISRAARHHDELLELLNHGIRDLQRRGVDQQLLARFLPQ